MAKLPQVNFSDRWVEPLLELARKGNKLEIRLAALAAVLRFPIEHEALSKVVEYVWELLGDSQPGSQVRLDALRLATRVPLVTTRERLRELADSPEEPDRAAIVAALEEAGDPSRIGELLVRARAGDENSFRLLAIAPLEHKGLAAGDVPDCPIGCRAETTFWHALALGRLGIYDAMDAVFTANAPVPEIFWGSPWTVWERIAVIRPCPSAMAAALADLLALAEGPTSPIAGDQARLRALQLTVWAVTGRADAEGQPVPPSREFGPVEAPSPYRTSLDLVPLLTSHLGAAQPEHDDGQIAWMLAKTPTNELIQKIVNMVQADRPHHERLRLLDILARTADCQSGSAPSPFRGSGGGAGRAFGKIELIDDRTRSLKRAKPPTQRDVPKTGTEDRRLSQPPRRITIDTAHVEYESDAAFVSRSTAFDDRADLAEAPLDDWAEPPLDMPKTAPPEPVPPEPTIEEEQRKVRARILQGKVERTTFLAGARNTIRCWIGLPEADGAADADQPIPDVAIPEEGLLLTVELLWNGQPDRGTMLLPASRTARSGDCDLHIMVPAEERYISADVIFRYGGRVFEAVKLEAAVLAPGDQAGARDELRIRVQLSRREVIALKDAKPCSATLMFGETPRTNEHGPAHVLAPAGGKPTLRVFDRNGARNYAIDPPDIAIGNLNASLFSTEKSLVRRRASSSDTEAGLDTDDEEVRILLRDLARFGAYLHKRLKEQGFEDPGERIQLLSLDPDLILPVEFVYDKGYPAEAAKLCGSWRNVLDSENGICPECGSVPATDADTGLASVICPNGFWSLTKVIERLNPDSAVSGSAPQQMRRNLPAIDTVLFAASNKVPEKERNEAWSTIQSQVGSTLQANTWLEWRREVKTHPRLLIALAHHDVEAVEDFIEIGDPTKGPDLTRLRRGQITADYVNPDGEDPGPILLLLGCKTGAESELGYSQLAREFQRLKTAIVLGTLAQILGRHAAPLAGELVRQLLSVKDADMDFGTVMRQVRRSMLARGYLLGFCLVAVGDAEWRLTPAS